jgi:hypothetical protein
MIEIPVVIVLMVLATCLVGGFVAGATLRDQLGDRRRDRALKRATPIWEVHTESDGYRDPFLGPRSGDAVIVGIRKVRRAEGQVEVLQLVKVGQVRGTDNPEKLVELVERAHTMINTMTIAGVA